jgi:hypothetical protein
MGKNVYSSTRSTLRTLHLLCKNWRMIGHYERPWQRTQPGGRAISLGQMSAGNCISGFVKSPDVRPEAYFLAGTHSMSHPLVSFDRVRIINLADRADRRREMVEQLNRIGGTTPSVSFFKAHRPSERGEFESIGARGCFESHLAVLRSARDDKVQNLLLLEDDFDFTRDGVERAELLLPQLAESPWDFFYGAHLLPAKGRAGLVEIPAEEPILTASFVAFRGRVIPMVVSFLEAMAKRPAGSPEYGPMHVDGAYTTFRNLNPQFATFAAFPAFGKQRSSRSDITPSGMILDRWSGTRNLAKLLRRTRNRLSRI